MDNTTYDYEIFHKEVKSEEIVLANEVEVLDYAAAGGCVPWVTGTILSIIFAVGFHSWLIFLVGIGITFAFGRIAQKARKKAEIAKNKTQENINQARQLSNQLNAMLKQSTALVQELPALLKKASASLERAKAEFTSNAFSPYWDCIEQATRHLATFNNSIQQIRNYADEYYRILQDKKHNFPSFLPEREIFPDPVPVINELNTVVRPALRNFQFATIWEHRKTQNILMEGFSTLGDAISNMAVSVSSSLGYLHDTISSSTAQIVDQQIMSRESYERYSDSHARLIEDQIKRLESLDRKIK
jgi:hypothetical protein